MTERHPYHDFYTYLDRMMGIPANKSGPNYWVSDKYASRPEAPTKEEPMASELGSKHPGTERLMRDLAAAVSNPPTCKKCNRPMVQANAVSIPTFWVCWECNERQQGNGNTHKLHEPCMVPHPQPTADGACTSAWENSADAEVTPDPYDGVPADVLPDAERSINKVVHTLQYSNAERQAKAEYMARVDECRGNAKMLLDMGHLEAAQLLVTRADALIARVPT